MGMKWLLLVAIVFVIWPQYSEAVTWVVNSTGDNASEPGTLRYVVEHQVQPFDTITFTLLLPSIALENPLPISVSDIAIIGRPTTITGPIIINNCANITISYVNFRNYFVLATNAIQVTLERCTFRYCPVSLKNVFNSTIDNNEFHPDTAMKNLKTLEVEKSSNIIISNNYSPCYNTWISVLSSQRITVENNTLGLDVTTGDYCSGNWSHLTFEVSSVIDLSICNNWISSAIVMDANDGVGVRMRGNKINVRHPTGIASITIPSWATAPSLIRFGRINSPLAERNVYTFAEIVFEECNGTTTVVNNFINIDESETYRLGTVERGITVRNQEFGRAELVHNLCFANHSAGACIIIQSAQDVSIDGNAFGTKGDYSSVPAGGCFSKGILLLQNARDIQIGGGIPNVFACSAFPSIEIIAGDGSAPTFFKDITIVSNYFGTNPSANSILASNSDLGVIVNAVVFNLEVKNNTFANQPLVFKGEPFSEYGKISILLNKIGTNGPNCSAAYSAGFGIDNLAGITLDSINNINISENVICNCKSSSGIMMMEPLFSNSENLFANSFMGNIIYHNEKPPILISSTLTPIIRYYGSTIDIPTNTTYMVNYPNITAIYFWESEWHIEVTFEKGYFPPNQEFFVSVYWSSTAVYGFTDGEQLLRVAEMVVTDDLGFAQSTIVVEKDLGSGCIGVMATAVNLPIDSVTNFYGSSAIGPCVIPPSVSPSSSLSSTISASLSLSPPPSISVTNSNIPSRSLSTSHSSSTSPLSSVSISPASPSISPSTSVTSFFSSSRAVSSTSSPSVSPPPSITGSETRAPSPQSVSSSDFRPTSSEFAPPKPSPSKTKIITSTPTRSRSQSETSTPSCGYNPERATIINKKTKVRSDATQHISIKGVTPFGVEVSIGELIIPKRAIESGCVVEIEQGLSEESFLESECEDVVPISPLVEIHLNGNCTLDGEVMLKLNAKDKDATCFGYKQTPKSNWNCLPNFEKKSLKGAKNITQYITTTDHFTTFAVLFTTVHYGSACSDTYWIAALSFMGASAFLWILVVLLGVYNARFHRFIYGFQADSLDETVEKVTKKMMQPSISNKY